MSTITLLRVKPSGKALGADIEGIDLSQPLDEETAAAIRNAWLDHLVLRFRGQSLTLQQLEPFSASFGFLYNDTATPEIYKPYLHEPLLVCDMAYID